MLGSLGCAGGLPFDGDDPAPAPVRDWRDEVVYQILTDRFANGDPTNDGVVDLGCAGCNHGGDWQGIIDRLDYLEALGVTAIWISPVVENADSPIGADAYHGYWPRAFDRTNPRYGSRADLQALVTECHVREIKVIVDVVVNHVGPVSYYDIDGDNVFAGVNELAPPFNAAGIPGAVVFFDPASLSPPELANPDWYNRRGQIQDFNVPEQSLLGDFQGGLRDLDTTREDVRDALFDVTVSWLDDVPLDGYRYDAAKHVEADFWPEFLQRVRDRTRGHEAGFFQFPEVLDGSLPNLTPWTASAGFDSVLNFHLKFGGFENVFVNGAPTTQLEEIHRQKELAFDADPHPGGITTGPRRTLVNFIDNHDVPRFLALTPDVPALHTALVYLLTTDGVPVIYYGTEQAFSGAIDPDNREDLSTSGYDTSGPTFELIATLNRLRQEHVALRRGETRFVWITDHTGGEVDAGIVAFERHTAEQRVLVVINTLGHQVSETRSVTFGDMQVGFPPGTVLRDLLAPGETFEVSASGSLVLSVPARGAKILVR